LGLLGERGLAPETYAVTDKFRIETYFDAFNIE